MKRIFVTGGAGFIGSNFVEQMVQNNIEVLVYDALTYAGHRENLDGITAAGKWHLEVGDITNAVQVRASLAAFHPDAIVHFAAESHVDNSIAGAAAFIHTNIEGSFVLLEEARRYYSSLVGKQAENFRFVQISTDEVFGDLELDEPRKFNEQSLMQPSSPYSASKAAADMLAHAWYKTYNLPTITTHCSNNYGPRQYPEKLIPVVLTKALARQPIPLYGDGKNVRDWIHVKDHCAGIFLALTKGKAGERYCFGGRAELDNRTLVEKICAILDNLNPRADGISYATQINFVKDRPGHDRRYAIDDSFAEKELGFTRQYNLENGMQATVKWYLENQNWCAAVLKKTSK